MGREASTQVKLKRKSGFEVVRGKVCRIELTAKQLLVNFSLP